MRSHWRGLPVALAAAVVLTACGGGFGTFAAPVAAVVGGTQITEAEVNAHVRLQHAQNQYPNLLQGPNANVVALNAKQQELTNLIQETAFVQRGTAAGAAVTQGAVDAAVQRTAAQYPSEAAFETALGKVGLSLDDYRQAQKLELAVQAVSTAVTKGIDASADQIHAFYQQNQSTFAGSYDAAEILICSHPAPDHSCAPTAADLAIAQQVAQKAQAGGDFAQLARQYSDDTGTKATGGDLGWQQAGALIPAFESAALALQPGQVTPQPVQTAVGYQVIKLIAKGEPEAAAADQINATLEQSARNQAANSFLQQAVAHTRIEVNPAFGSFDADTLAVSSPAGSVSAPNADQSTSGSSGLGGLSGLGG
ncbi:MAG TPA: peptidylprolyl isomerase [Actinomycetota bacterium]|nr:peptidylprolyl isomerase [Actinomycetota bacterium]